MISDGEFPQPRIVIHISLAMASCFGVFLLTYLFSPFCIRVYNYL
jgi:hypothetical protein